MEKFLPGFYCPQLQMYCPNQETAGGRRAAGSGMGQSLPRNSGVAPDGTDSPAPLGLRRSRAGSLNSARKEGSSPKSASCCLARREGRILQKISRWLQARLVAFYTLPRTLRLSFAGQVRPPSSVPHKHSRASSLKPNRWEKNKPQTTTTNKTMYRRKTSRFGGFP